MLETALGTFIDERTPLRRTRQNIVADTVVRLGLPGHVEAEVGWAPLTYLTVNNLAEGSRMRAHGTGDTRVSLLYGLLGADGPAAIEVGVSLPTGHAPVGSQRWTAQTRLPLTLPSIRHVGFALTPEVDAAANDEGDGHHASVGAAGGMAVPLSASVQLDADVAMFTALQPVHRSTTRTAGVAVAWHFQRLSQLDVGGTVMLSRREPGLQLYAGWAHRF